MQASSQRIFLPGSNRIFQCCVARPQASWYYYLLSVTGGFQATIINNLHLQRGSFKNSLLNYFFPRQLKQQRFLFPVQMGLPDKFAAAALSSPMLSGVYAGVNFPREYVHCDLQIPLQHSQQCQLLTETGMGSVSLASLAIAPCFILFLVNGHSSPCHYIRSRETYTSRHTDHTVSHYVNTCVQ